MPVPAHGAHPLIEVMLTMWPERAARIPGNTAWIIATEPSTLTVNRSRISSRLVSSMAPTMP
jgi:hypothetical protein